jgi:hypothetical protein
MVNLQFTAGFHFMHAAIATAVVIGTADRFAAFLLVHHVPSE